MNMFCDSDSESRTESTDSEEHDGIESAYSGRAWSILSCLDETIEKIDDFLAFQRGFVHGDIVCSISDPSKQLGRVVDVDMSVDLENISGELIEGVNSKKLVKVCPFSLGDYVIHGHWLGRVSRVVDRVTVLLNNGSKCEIMVGDSDDVVPLSPILFEIGSHPLYCPGQRVSVNHNRISENGRWLYGSWKAGRTEGTICHAEVGFVHVKWVTSLMCLGCISSPPNSLQDPGMLTLLSCFPYANWQIGDCCTLPPDYQNYSKMADKEPVFVTVAPQFTKMDHSGVSDQLCKEIYSIARIRTKIDVLWQNGLVSAGVDPEVLLPASNIGEHDFWPGQFVTEKVTCEDMEASSVQHLGVVKSVESLEQIVKVKWITAEPKKTENFNRDMEEIISAYELIEHPDASYLLGDIVIRFPNCENFENIPNLQIGTEQILEHKSIPAKKITIPSLLHANDYKKKALSYGLDSCPASYASCIGFVIGFTNESVLVRWTSGLISKVHPYEIFSLDRLDELDTSSAVHQVVENVQDENSRDVKWQENEVENDSNGDFKRGLWDAGFLSLPLVTFRFLTSVAERLFSIGGSSSPSFQKLRDFNCLDINVPSLGGEGLQFEDWKEVVKCEEEENGRPAFTVGRERPERFKHFDSVFDYLDHRFANCFSKNVTAYQVKNDWLKKVHHEWSILKKNLPESIYVRVYEERVDLLRASIAGQPGTPYYHGLFFFDINLPDNYPQGPPIVHYHSGGLKLNPNLHESGKICLSLLNTWAGSGTEVWNPDSSTILQVLLSLQALVLNDKPYFNEADYDKQIGRAEAERNSINYNENAFLLTLKSMIYIMKQPPKHFEAYVKEHFVEHAHDILLACKAYMDGAPVGSYGSGMGSKDSCRNNSAGFRIMLVKIFPMLVSSFAAKGIDCSQFINQGNQLTGFTKDLNSI
ncbi:probable ubiquitin-conjugating enzyme E2 24 isoform X2 [Phalaenopsis equestris]|uniref:probable ubiquitin-conjugating enzyme E2 24 isoform X2 n=1 Tax=Phalaenopsis equestris TaxID=78828 RepID=UPI0009E400B9|nr:probable ubiquitin-conjugating enzyme E2 24 isoform X2 [Phalaenopsis equestris]